MNSHKRGKRYHNPVPFIQGVATIYVLFSILYRPIEEFLWKLSPFVVQDLAAGYTTLFRRIRQLELPFSEILKPTSGNVAVVIDSTRIKATNRGK